MGHGTQESQPRAEHGARRVHDGLTERVKLVAACLGRSHRPSWIFHVPRSWVFRRLSFYIVYAGGLGTGLSALPRTVRLCTSHEPGPTGAVSGQVEHGGDGGVSFGWRSGLVGGGPGGWRGALVVIYGVHHIDKGQSGERGKSARRGAPGPVWGRLEPVWAGFVDLW